MIRWIPLKLSTDIYTYLLLLRSIEHYHFPWSSSFICGCNKNGNQPVFSPFFKRKQRNTDLWTIDIPEAGFAVPRASGAKKQIKTGIMPLLQKSHSRYIIIFCSVSLLFYYLFILLQNHLLICFGFIVCEHHETTEQEFYHSMNMVYIKSLLFYFIYIKS
jgi:hypothetical protein